MSVGLRHIQTKADYETALAEVKLLWGAKTGIIRWGLPTPPSLQHYGRRNSSHDPANRHNLTETIL